MADELVNDAVSPAGAVTGSDMPDVVSDGASDAGPTPDGPPADDLVNVAAQSAPVAQIVSDALSDAAPVAVAPVAVAPVYPVAPAPVAVAPAAAVAPAIDYSAIPPAVAPAAVAPVAPASPEAVSTALTAIGADAKSRGARTLAQGAVVAALMSAGGVAVGYLQHGDLMHLDYKLVGITVGQAAVTAVAAYVHRVMGLNATAE